MSSSDDPAEPAEAIARRAQAHFDAGEWQAALDASEQSTALFRELAHESPSFRPGLARALLCLAESQSALGLHDDAISAAYDAVEFRRDLARAQPAVFHLDLAKALGRLSVFRSLAGQPDEALRDAEVGLTHFRELAAANRDLYALDLAGQLTGVARCRHLLGDYARALGDADEAIAICREPALRGREGARGQLAVALNVRAAILLGLDRAEASTKSSAEALRIARALAEHDPVVWNPRVANMLSMLAAGQYRAERRWLAIRSCDEAIERFRKLAAERPAFRLEIAELLPRLGELLALVHEHERALETFEEWVALVDELGRVNGQTPAAGEIAQALRLYAEGLETFGRTEEARRSIELADRLAPAEA